jgi:hypothetical protein
LIANLFWALGKVIRLKKAVIIVDINKSGPKFNIHTDNTFEKVKLVVNETINKSIDVGLGRGI